MTDEMRFRPGDFFPYEVLHAWAEREGKTYPVKAGAHLRVRAGEEGRLRLDVMRPSEKGETALFINLHGLCDDTIHLRSIAFGCSGVVIEWGEKD